MLRRVFLPALCLAVSGCLLLAPEMRARAQAAAEVPEYHNACLNEAVSTKDILQTSDHFIYTCFGETAQKYFQYLQQKGATEKIDKEPTATWTFYAIPQGGRCWNRYDDAYDVPESSFGCSINLTKRR